MTPVEVLTAARELIADPDHWCQLDTARDEVGNRVSPTDSHAVQWCAIGAVKRVLGRSPEPSESLPLVQNMDGFIGRFNDSHTHGEVLAAFDRAIEAAQ